MRIRILTAIIIVIIWSCNDQGSSSNLMETLSEHEVRDFVHSYDSMWAKRDTASMKEAMSDNYIYFSSTGRTIDRRNILGWFVPDDKYKVDSAARSEIFVKIEGNTAIVSSRWVGKGSFSGEKFEDDQRCGLIIRKENDKLKILSEHCTQILK